MDNNIDYFTYLKNKMSTDNTYGFDPIFIPDKAFDFQSELINYVVKKGRSAIFADCGLGKSVIELAFAQNIVEKTNKNVLFLTPIAVGIQMKKEADKFGIEVHKSRDKKVHGKITITNYEQLKNFNPDDFEAIICDESSILKNFNGKIKHEINIFMRKIKYRLLATATAAPNDFIELGTSSEALGYLGYMDMLSKFFINISNSGGMSSKNTRNRWGTETKWRLKKHAHISFWKWVTSWSRAMRYPSDMGFDDTGYILPELKIIDNKLNIIRKPKKGTLFSLPAVGLKEQREERRETIQGRCERAAEIAMSNDKCFVIWCNLNAEGDLLEKIIPESVQVSGRDSDESKEEKLNSFSNGKIKRLITKPKIGGWGLNWQHCNNVIFFPTHSYEQYYQAIRRCWRFGQDKPVTVNMVYTNGDENVITNLKRKEKQASEMFDVLIKEMNNSLSINHINKYNKKFEVPEWL